MLYNLKTRLLRTVGETTTGVVVLLACMCKYTVHVQMYVQHVSYCVRLCSLFDGLKTFSGDVLQTFLSAYTHSMINSKDNAFEQLYCFKGVR